MIVKTGRKKIIDSGFNENNIITAVYLGNKGDTITTADSELEIVDTSIEIENFTVRKETDQDLVYCIEASYTADKNVEISELNICCANNILFSRVVFPMYKLHIGDTITLKYYLYF